MIKTEGTGHELRFKCVFNLNEDDCYELECEKGFMKIRENSLIVSIETATMLSEKIISLEIISLPHKDLSYKKFIIVERELRISDGIIRKKAIDALYNNIMCKEALSTIIIDAINELDNSFFC